MRTLGNILWHFPCFGFVSAGGTFLLGVLLTGTVVAAPIGLGLIQFSKFLLAPFGQTMIRKSTLGVEQNKAWLAYSWLVTIIYFPFGLLCAAAVALEVAALCLTIIGIPLAIIVAKCLGTYFNPVNKTIFNENRPRTRLVLQRLQ